MLFTGDVIAQFLESNFTQFTGDPTIAREVGFSLSAGDARDGVHMLTPWSRSQVLSTVGVREKWFGPVSPSMQADELNMRISIFREHRFRACRTVHDGLFLLRGIVSRQYADIPDTDVMQALTSAMPDGKALSRVSVKTDRAFYAYALSDQTISIPGTDFKGVPGVVLRNSEVGFTSLWVIPCLALPSFKHPIIFANKTVLRRAHRGSVKELEADFEKAIAKASVVWAELGAAKMHLRQVTYQDEDAAVAWIHAVIARYKGAKNLASRAETDLRAAGLTKFTGNDVFASLLRAINSLDVNIGHAESSIAGAVLWHLLT